MHPDTSPPPGYPAGREPIAIIGIGCRFPGGVDSPSTFWQLLREGGDAITEIPPDRFDVDAYYDPTPATPGKIMSRWGGFLTGIDQFDAAAFNISPREAERLDPQQRLLLEVGWEALADAGLPLERLAGSATGVFVGLWLNDYEARLYAAAPQIDFYMTTGSGRYSASGRLSYTFGFQGPSLTLDTACSSSLVAVHLACRSLWAGECEVALAGGANVVLQPHITIAYSQSRMMAPDGRCKFGDARANGYVRSDGAGLVVLKRLSQAQADGDPIYAVVRGSAVNNDGRGSGFMTTPASAGQEEMLRLAYADAGVSPGQVQYVEAHGTGTSAGDPVEIGALGAVLAQGRAAGRPCRLGSVKTNFGHTEGAAGVAGLIKAALALHHGLIPASLNLQELNPQIPWAHLPVEIQRRLGPWPAPADLPIAGVSSFGIAGTNAHVVLQAAPERPTAPAQLSAAYVLPLSAYSPEALRAVARQYRAVLTDAAAPAADVCYTAAVRRSHLDYRLAVVGGSAAELAEGLESAAQAPDDVPAGAGRPRVVFVFPGQGSQWLGMGRQLLEQAPAFRAALERCAQALQPFTDWSVLEQLAADGERSRLDEIDVVQPLLFAIEVALAAQWRAWGVEPDAVVGHSLGEVAAAQVAGALSLEDAARIICQRSRLMKRVSGQGAMAVVELSLAEAQAAVASYAGRLGVAVSNGPRSTVISGEPAALAALTADLQGREVFCRPVKVDVAAHSPQMEPLRPVLVAALEGLQPRATDIPLYSTVTGQAIAAETLDAAYWGRNLREPVLFDAAVRQLLADGFDTFIELSPHPVLLAALPPARALTAVPSLRRGEPELAGMLAGLGALYARGYPVEWQRLYPVGQPVRLPPYPWQRERFWFEEAAADRPAAGPRRRGLLGEHVQSALQAGAHFWDAELSLALFPYLAEHQVRERAVLPAAVVVELCLTAAQTMFGAGPHTFEQVSIQEALFLDQPRRVQVAAVPALTDAGGAGVEVRVLSRPLNAAAYSGADDGGWTLHAVGRLRPGRAAAEPPAFALAALQARCGQLISGGAHYQAMAARGLNYGPAFQGVAQLWLGEAEGLGRLKLPAAADDGRGPQTIHPALLDAGFQLLVAGETDDPTDPLLPVSVAQARVWAPVPAEVWGYVRRTATAGDLMGDVFLLDDDGRVLAEVRGLRLQRLAETRQFNVADSLYEVRWQALAAEPNPPPVRPGGRWLVFADARGVAAAVAGDLSGQGGECVTVTAGAEFARLTPRQFQIDVNRPEDFQRLLREAFPEAAPCRGVIHAWGLDALTTDDELGAPVITSVGVLHLVQALARAAWPEAPRLWLVTAGAQAVGEAPAPVSAAQTALWGLAGTIAHEHPELRCGRVDLSAAPGPAETRALTHLLLADGQEDQLALRGAAVYVARLAHAQVSGSVERPTPPAVDPAAQPFRFAVTRPGLLDTLGPRPFPRRAPGPGQVEIAVHTAGVNFINVMSALGIYPGAPQGVGPLGLECAGIISRVGEGVRDLSVGEAVLAVAPDCLGTHVLADARLVLPKPAGLSWEQAATVPIVFLTAHYALTQLARLQPGERVLIHAAAGGVGLAALQLARRAGAEILATAGSAEKRAYLTALGVRHVFDSRSLDFADEVLTATAGEGVDVVLNSLAGDAIVKGLTLLKPFGRFVEIGKRDIYQNSQIGLWPFQKNLAYFAVDLDRMSREKPGAVRALLQEVLELLAAGALAPLPVRVFPAAQAADAFRFMAQAQHIGKLAVSVQDQAGLPAMTAAPPLFRPDAAYLITGGLGGLGLAVAGWMVSAGARHLALLGRRAPGAEAQAALAALTQEGAVIRVLAADVAEAAQLDAALAEIEHALPPLRGVVHAAGLLDDGILLQQDAARFQAVLRPKAAGAWNLHRATRAAPLDFFVMFSSIASLLGTPGQGNYAAANAFMDGLAHARRAQGRPALSLNWGPWAEIGLAADRGRHLAQRGVTSLTPEQGLAALAQVLYAGNAQLGVMPLEVRRWLAAQPDDAHTSLWAGLRTPPPAGAAPADAGAEAPNVVRAALLAAAPGRPRWAVLETYLRQQAAQVLRLAPARLDAHKPLRALGFDSLMTIEFRNRLEAGLGLRLPATLVWNYPTVADLVPHLAGLLGIALDSAAAAPAAEPAAAELPALAADEVEKLLADELDAIDALLKGDQ